MHRLMCQDDIGSVVYLIAEFLDIPQTQLLHWNSPRWLIPMQLSLFWAVAAGTA
jgi:hypothetical protein